MKKPLHIPASKKTSSLYIWCQVCRTQVVELCKKTGEPLSKCKEGNSHSYRAVVYEPGTGKRHVRHLGRDLEQARKATIDLRAEIRRNSQQKETKEVKTNQPETQKGLNLLLASTRHIAHLRGLRGAAHTLPKNLTEPYIKSIERYHVLFGQALKMNGVNPKTICVEDITQEHIGFFHTFLLEQKKYESKTYNSAMDSLTLLFNYLKKHEGFKTLENPFEEVRKLKVIPKKIETIEPHEFSELLALADDPTKGEQTLSTGQKKQIYFSFNRDFFIAGYMLGLRREQLVSIRFSHFKEDPATHEPIIITSNNLKVERIMKDGEARITAVPVSPQFREYLYNNLNYEANRGTDKYLIADDSPYKRKTIMDIVSKAFTHYWKQLPYSKDKDISFSNLRKTYATQLQLLVGSNARFITNHTPEVIDKHYTNREAIAKEAGQHNLYPTLNLTTERRQHELEKARVLKQEKQKGIEKEI